MARTTGDGPVVNFDHSSADALDIIAEFKSEGNNVVTIRDDGQVAARSLDVNKTLDNNDPVILIRDDTQGGAAIDANTGIIIGNLGLDTQGGIRFNGSSFEGNVDGTSGGWISLSGASSPWTGSPNIDYSGGNVSIGDGRLDVIDNGTGDATVAIRNSGSGDVITRYEGESAFYSVGIDNSDGDKFKITSATALGSSGNDRLTIDSEGDVGLNFTNPEGQLHIRSRTNTDSHKILTVEEAGDGLEVFTVQNSGQIFIDPNGLSNEADAIASTSGTLKMDDDGEIFVDRTDLGGGGSPWTGSGEINYARSGDLNASNTAVSVSNLITSNPVSQTPTIKTGLQVDVTGTFGGTAGTIRGIDVNVDRGSSGSSLVAARFNGGDIEINDGNLEIEETSAGDVIMRLRNSSNSVYTLGIDDSDADKFKIASGSSLGVASEIEIDASGILTANAFVGDGSGLTGLPSSSPWTGSGEINYTRSGVISADNTAVSISNLSTTPSASFFNKTALKVDASGSFGVDASSDIIGLDVSVDGPGNKYAAIFSGGSVVTEGLESTSMATGVLNVNASAPLLDIESTDDSNDAYARFITSSAYTVGVDLSDNSFKITDGFSFNVGQDRIVIDEFGDVGIGTSSPSTRLNVVGDTDLEGNLYTSGNVGIGTSSPDMALEVNGTNTVNSYSSSTAGMIRGDNFTTAGGVGVVGAVNTSNTPTTGNRYGLVGMGWYGASANYGARAYGFGGTAAYGIYAEAGGTTTNNVYGIYATTYSGTNRWAGWFNGRIRVTGDIEYSGSFVNVSDRRLKENITPLSDALTKLQKLKGYSYSMIADSTHAIKYGLMAQDVQEVLPYAVSTIDKEKGHLGLAYNQLIPVLVDGVNEQQNKISNLELQIEELKALLAKSESEREKMSTQVDKQATEIAEIRKVLGLSSGSKVANSK